MNVKCETFVRGWQGEASRIQSFIKMMDLFIRRAQQRKLEDIVWLVLGKNPQRTKAFKAIQTLLLTINIKLSTVFFFGPIRNLAIESHQSLEFLKFLNQQNISSIVVRSITHFIPHGWHPFGRTRD